MKAVTNEWRYYSMNIYDIAKEAGVSPATVSRVINGNKNVREETRRKVLEVIKENNYAPSSVARNLSIGESQNIAFIVPDVENPFFSKVLQGITDKASEFNYNVFMFGTKEDSEREHRILESLKAELIKGLIIIPVSEIDKETAFRLKNFEKAGIPVVLLDRDIKGSSFDGVFSEDIQGAFEAVECLINEGHRKIAIISGPDTSRPGHDRVEGYKMALTSHQIPINEDYIVNGKFLEEESYNAIKTLMELEDPPTAVFSSNNMTTLGCLRYLKENGMKLVEDISLVGFDDIKELEYTDINLTVVARPVYEMGKEVMELLERRFRYKQEGDKQKVVTRRNYVKTWLIKRGSEKYKKFQEGNINE
jgi:LacI family transcriptional regulator